MQGECEQQGAACTTCLPAQGPRNAGSANGPDFCVRESREEMAASKALSCTVAGCPFSFCATLALPGRHARGRPLPWGAVPPTTQTVATRAAAAAPVGGGGGLGRGELPTPTRACAAAGCPARSPPLHTVANRRVFGVGARPQGLLPPVRRAGDPCGASTAEVGPPPGGGVAPRVGLPRRADGFPKRGRHAA